MSSLSTLQFHPVTPDRWPDLDRLFRASAGEALGNPSRCWCMEWRLAAHAEWRQGAGEPNRRAMRAVVASGQVPGILAYTDGEPAGWCSVSPRPALPGLKQLASYYGLEEFEDTAVWVVLCFYVPESHRGQGLMLRLLEAATSYAIASGAHVVEGYPAEPQYADDGAGGTIPVFQRAGYAEARRLGPHQALMRHYAPHA